MVNTSKYACRGRRSRSFSLHGTGSKIKCNIDYFFFVLRIGTAFEKAAVVVQIVLESKINISVCYFT